MANNLEKLTASLAASNIYEFDWGDRPFSEFGITTPPIELQTQYFVAPFETDCRYDCEECAKHFRPVFEQIIDSRVYADKMTDKEVEEIASTLTARMLQDLNDVRERLVSHGNAILSRWNKKTSEQRKALIREVAPDMYEFKMPQARIFYEHPGWLPKRPFRKMFLLPYLTIDNICDDKSKLLSLLYFRTESEPEDWVMFDSEQLDDGYSTGSLEVRFNANCIVMHGSRFGSVVRWNREDAHAWNIVGWPRARLILEAQAELIGFLHNIVEKLLEGYEGTGGCDKWKKVMTAGFKASGSQELWSAYGKQAFSASPKFNPITLLELAKARLAAGEDELELLQTDPAYTLMQVNKLFKLDVYKALEQATGDAGIPLAHEVSFAAFNRAQKWRWITQELTYVCELHQKYSQSITTGRRLPETYARALGALQRLVINLQSREVQNLQRTLPVLPAFQDHYEYVDLPEQGPVMERKRDSKQWGTPIPLISRDPLFWALLQLQTTEPREVVEFKQARLLEFIDDHVATSGPKEKARIDQRTYDCLADMAGIDSILCALRYARPFAVALDHQTAVKSQGGRGGGLSTWRNCLIEPPQPPKEAMYKVSSTLQAFMKQEWPKGKRNRAWLQQADRSREALSLFWDATRSMLLDCLNRSTRAQEEIDYEIGMTKFASRPSYVAQLEAGRRAILEPKEDLSAAPSEFLLYSWTQTETGSAKSEIVRNANLLIDKADKKKRRLQEAAVKNYDAKHHPDFSLASVEAGTTAPQITVNLETFRVFDKIFMNDTAAKASLKWQQFVAAMVEAGCSATQSSGSAVTFKHEHQGAIVFHRPHPEPTIDSVMLHVMGKRLTKWFGWCRGTFVERKKGEV